MAGSVMQQLIEYGEVRRGRLGVTTQDLTPDLARAFGIDRNHGTVIAHIAPDSPANRAKLKAGDVILEINGKPVRSSGDVRNRVGLLRVGSKVEMTIWRNGRTLKRSLVVASSELAEINGGTLHPQLAGATFSKLPERLQRRGEAGGILVSAVQRGSAAWQAGLREHDIILSANRIVLRSLQDFRKAVQGQRQLLINVQRGDGAMFVLLQ
jgi:serine protease Do/serine protease DegQ